MRENHAVSFDNGIIRAVEGFEGPADHDIVTAGFVDLQVNGHDDVDVATADAHGWERLLGLLAAQGVTTWLPTLVTAPLEVLDRTIERLSGLMVHDGPEAVGIHLEGPFLGAAPGAHQGVDDNPIDLAWIASLPPAVRLMTLGPERRGAIEAIGRLGEKGIVAALGHTMASAARTEAAVDAGARLFTHAFNASGTMHHRAPGALGVALTDDRVTVSLIADGVHVDPRMLRLAWRAKPAGRVALVTDATGWRAGRLGDAGVELRDGAPRLADGTLAGSALRMPEALRYCVDELGIPLVEALAAASTVPAGVLGLGDRGSITPGRRADLVALSDDLQVERSLVGGVAQPPAGSGT